MKIVDSGQVTVGRKLVSSEQLAGGSELQTADAKLLTKQLPKGWIETKLGDVSTHPQYGWTCSSIKDGKIKLLRTTDISNGKVDWNDVPYCSQVPEQLEKYLLKRNDILVSRAGSVGVSYCISENDLEHETVFASYLIRFCPLIPASFVYHYFKSHKYWHFISGTQLGIAVPNVNATKLAELPIPLPPLNEQKRIVAKLDAIMPRIEAVKERLDKVPTILKRFRQSVLTAAVTGRLTDKWREEHPDVESAEVLLKDIIIDKPRNGYSPTAVKYETPVKSLTLTATTSGKFDSSCYKFIDEAIANDSHLWLEKDDILIQRSNSINYVGISAIYNGGSFEFIYPDLMMKVKANKDLVFPSFLVLALQSYKTLDYFRKNATGTAGSMPKINQSIVMNTPILLPSLKEQKEIVRQVDKLFALADKVEAHYLKAKARVDKLAQSILAKAFRGELVPQDPNDEPAEKLLERILEEKAKLVGSKQLSGGRKKKSVGSKQSIVSS